MLRAERKTVPEVNRLLARVPCIPQSKCAAAYDWCIAAIPPRRPVIDV